MSTLEQLDCAMPAKMANTLRQTVKELQMMPEAATNALTLIQEPDCSIARFAEIVERDVKLAADILRVANSPFYSAGRAIGNLREAVVQVGFRQCQNLIQACCASSLMQRLDGLDEQTRHDLWQHSLLTGRFATELNQVLKLGFAGEEFTAGIMHDIGRLLLAVLFPQEFHTCDPVDFSEANWSPGTEQAVMAADHCVVGCSFAVSNGLPNEVAAAIRFHHEPTRANVSPQLVALIAAADDLANYIGRAQTGEAYCPDGNKGLAVLLEVTSSECEQSAAEIADKILAQQTVNQA